MNDLFERYIQMSDMMINAEKAKVRVIAFKELHRLWTALKPFERIRATNIYATRYTLPA
jgi:hypothetical protein